MSIQMKYLLLVLAFAISLESTAQMNKILGTWCSKKMVNKVPFRVLSFYKDSTYTETATISIGSIQAISMKYHFLNNQIIDLQSTKKEECKIIFHGKDKLKFELINNQKDSLTDRMFGLTFKRAKSTVSEIKF